MEEKQNRKVVARRKARNIAITIGILLVLLIAFGVAYTWYVGQQGPGQAKTVATPQTEVLQPIKPTAPKPGTQESAAIEYLSTPIAPGDSASVNVKTVATSNCNISVAYNNVPSTDTGLKPKVADDFGNVEWDWTVGKSTPLGTWPVKVTCSWHGKTAVVQGDLVVAR